MAVVKTEGKRAEDVLVNYWDYGFCVETVTVFNPNDAGGPLDFQIGEVLKLSSGQYIKNTDNSGDAVLLESVKALADNGTKKVKAVVRGPAILDANQLVHNGGVAATQIAALLTKQIKCVPEPLKVTVAS